MADDREIRLDHPVFHELKPDDTDLLLRSSAVLYFRRNETILKQDGYITHVHFLLSGMAKVDYQAGGQSNTIRVVPEQRFVGLLYTFYHHQYRISATAITDCRILQFDLEAFKSVMRRNGNFALAITNTLTITATRIVDRLLTYYNRNVEGSLAAFLLQLHELHGVDTFTIPLNRREIAETIGYTRESVVHTFSKFARQGLIAQQGHEVTLQNVAQLKEILHKS